MRSAYLLPLLATTLCGCIVNVDFDPVGSAASVQGSWTVEGAPPTAESCAEIAYVRVRFFEDDERRDHAGLVFECAAGGFDTRPERVIAQGLWTVALVAIRADGSVVEMGPMVELDTRVEGGDHLIVPPVDLAGGG